MVVSDIEIEDKKIEEYKEENSEIIEAEETAENEIDTTEKPTEEILDNNSNNKTENITEEISAETENTEALFVIPAEEEVTCHIPVILTESENSIDIDTEAEIENIEQAEEISQKDDFEIAGENQYQLFPNYLVTEKNKETIETETEELQEEIIEETESAVQSDEVLENTEIIDEIIPENPVQEISEQEIYEPKTVVLDFQKEMGKFETALEIKYSSLKLSQFPIKISNIPEGMTFPDEVVIGNTNIKIGNDSVNNCILKILSNESIKMLEIKHREFKLRISVSLNNDTINVYGNVRYYEISSLIKYSRMLKVLEMFDNIFNGSPIFFKVNRLFGDIVVEDRIELMRVKTIEQFFSTLDKSGYKFQIDKLPESDNVYYLLELNSAFKEKRIIETWCNFNLNNEYVNLNIGDSLIIKRIYKIDKHLSLEEKITLRNPLDKYNIFKEKTAGYRKPCVIEISQVNN